MVDLLARANDGASANGIASSDEFTSQFYSKAYVTERRRAEAWLNDRIAKGKREGFHAEKAELTPVLAEILICRNPDNRPRKSSNLQILIRSIKDGDYEFNGEPIIISDTGDMNDGQHRCIGVLEAGRSIETVFVFGVSRSSRLTVDTGTARTSGDLFAMNKIPYHNQASAVASILWQLERHGRPATGSGYRPTKPQVRQTFQEHPEIIDSVKAVPSKGAALCGGLTTLALCHYLIAKKNKEGADHFIKTLVTGHMIATNDPISICRERLHADYRERDERFRLGEKIELIFNAWNAHRRKRKSLRKGLTGTLPELEA